MLIYVKLFKFSDYFQYGNLVDSPSLSHKLAWTYMVPKLSYNRFEYCISNF